MACSNQPNIRIEPVNVTWEIEQKDCVEVNQVAASLDAAHFLLGDQTYVWFNLDASSVDPAPAGRVGIEVSVTTGQTAAQVASALQTAVEADAGYSAVLSGSSVSIEKADTADVANAADVDTGFVFHVLQEGGSLDLGSLQGNVESTFEEAILDITQHQTGTTIIDALRQGVSAEISLTMQEAADVAKLKEIYAKTGGDAYTPAAGTEVFGWGSSRQGDSVLPQSRRLNLHPVNAGADLSRDLTFWKAYPLPDTLVISGEETKTLSVSFRLFLDQNKRSELSLFCFGDYTQDLNA